MTRDKSYKVKEETKSGFEKLKPASYFRKFLDVVSKETSLPKEKVSFPITPEKCVIGDGVNPMLVLTPA